jgi:anti-sigma B factor antagonist
VASSELLLRMSVSRTGRTTVLALAGEADIAGETRLRGRLQDLVGGTRPDPVCELVVDLSGLTFMDLSALNALRAASQSLHRRGGSLFLRSPTRRVRRLLSVMDPDGRLPVVD